MSCRFVKAADAQKAAAAGRVLVRGRTVRVGENRDDTRVERVECSSCRQLLSKVEKLKDRFIQFVSSLSC
jgi:hypothetical protein